MNGAKNILIVLLLWFMSTNSYAEKKGFVSRASTPPSIDGIKEALWSESANNTIEYIINGTVDSKTDLSASWTGLWDQENLYFLVEVTDELLKNSGPSTPKFYIHDCVELFLDMLNEKNSVATGASETDDKYQYRFIYGLDSEPVFENPPSAGIINVSRATVSGYIIEVKIPWATIIGTHPFGELIIGKSIGAEFQVADLDNNPGEWMPDANLAWNNPTGADLKVARNFGTIVLVENNLPDVTAPAAIADLSGVALGAIDARLNWTSPGDDQSVGLATAYEIRYSTSSINENNWTQATRVDTALEARIAGTAQEYHITGLTGSTTYYFALKTMDDAGNASPVSNNTVLTTAAADIIAPSAISDLKITAIRPISLEIQWTSTGDDAHTGQAKYYDIRYSRSPITALNWESAAKASNLPVPEIAGVIQSMIIIGLSPLTTYYIAIKVTDEQKNVSELSNPVNAKTGELIINAKTSMDQFMGTNAFIDDPLDKLKVGGYIREYHPWNWDEGDIYSGGSQSYAIYPNNKNAFNPSTAAGGNSWFFDDYYKKLTQAGIMVCPSIMGSVAWLNSTNNFGESNIPVRPGLDRNDPQSYKEHADHLFQYAARYGNEKIADSLLKLADNQPRVSGLGYLKYLENWNEPDRYWGTVDENFTPENLAAMGSADRDGHCGEMGKTFGVKNADPNMKLVMGGLARLSIPYIDEVRKWCINNRKDKAFAYDVINVHHYCLSKSPEEAKLKEQIQALVDYRDQFLPDIEIWMTEFGWDTSIYPTDFSSPSIGTYSREEVQAQWIIREYLLLSSTGIDRAAQYMLRDADSDGRIQFASSGLVTEKGQWEPKPSFYYTYTTRNALKGMYYTGEQASMNANVQIYTYENPQRDTMVYVLWSPTSNGTTEIGYSLGLVNSPKSANLVQLTNGSITGTTTEIRISRNSLKVDVSERPVFVVTTTNSTVSSTIFDKGAEEITIYPNPTTDMLNIEVEGFDEKTPVSVRICTLDGADVWAAQYNQSVIKLNVSDLKSGIYLVKVKTSHGLKVRKFIKY